MAVDIDIVYEGSLWCAATHRPSGHTIQTEAPVDNGGKGEAFSPTDLVAAALGTCLATIMGLVAERHGIDIQGMRVHVSKEMATDPHRRIGSLTVVVTVPRAGGLSEEDRKRFENAAVLCPVMRSFHPDVSVAIRFAYSE